MKVGNRINCALLVHVVVVDGVLGLGQDLLPSEALHSGLVVGSFQFGQIVL